MSLGPGEFGPGSTWRLALRLVPALSLVGGVRSRSWNNAEFCPPGGFTPAPDATLSFAASQCSGLTQGGSPLLWVPRGDSQPDPQTGLAPRGA